ncbi:ABC transporter ATP-binding protein [Mesorhizobium sp. J428]|uniref:ABC transporter ATP-binding protein n=1 Tax=Mesorhizobium sp. J428 TaxID=2898440 RepID=UPI0021510C0C|nr:ABC transporter ATP-binding protein [Mesorhizobium sp. J428]MCR5856429.1 ABC transporter ATP-binding protein [Mesorhizobium sp. J428]
MAKSNEPLLAVQDLSIRYGADVPLVEQLNFTVERGETVGLVGESGCGKSLTALAVMGLLPQNLKSGGGIRLGDTELTKLDARSLRKIRGSQMAMIFQEPLTALNPVMTIGAQVVEVLRAHNKMSSADAERRAIELLELVRIPDAAARFNDYPHRLSGGMRQRVVIAIAIACNPALLIADEPTTALDVTVQAQILRLLKRLQQDADLGLLLITHDLGVVRQVADRIVVMYAGSVVEEGPVDAVLDNPRHPYTAGLLAARPHGSHNAGAERLADIRGTVPAPEARPGGCQFEPRCAYAQADCRAARPPLSLLAGGRALRCYHPVGGAH